MNQREKLMEKRNALLAEVEAERAENRKYGIKHLSQASVKKLNRVWNIDEDAAKLTVPT